MARIVVVGGGFAGTLVAAELDREADVVLVDPREAFVNVAALLRALTRPDWAPNAFLAYADLLPHGQVVRDSVVSVDPRGVRLAGGERLEADHVVLATGSDYPYPAHPRESASSTEDALADLRATHAELARAQHVLVVGAGPVGLELAGEIREVWPQKAVTVVSRGERLLPQFRPELHTGLVEQLTALGVTVRLSTDLEGLPPVPAATHRPFRVATTGGSDLEADLWFHAFGSRVQTDYLRDGRLVGLTGRGTVPVTEHLTVVGAPHVYAVGDIAELPDLKMATHAQVQAATVVENLRAELAGRPPSAAYVPATSQRILLPLGTRGGVGQVTGPDGSPVVVPVEVVQERKGRDLFTDRLRRRFSRTAA